jgi:hypothetical protein
VACGDRSWLEGRVLRAIHGSSVGRGCRCCFLLAFCFLRKNCERRENVLDGDLDFSNGADHS